MDKNREDKIREAVRDLLNEDEGIRETLRHHSAEVNKDGSLVLLTREEENWLNVLLLRLGDEVEFVNSPVFVAGLPVEAIDEE